MTTTSLLLLSGCNFFDKPPTADEVYKAVSGMKEQPFNIEGVDCKVASGAHDCQFSASIVAGYVPGYVGDTRPDYKIVQIRGRFTKTGDRWAASDLALLTTP